MSDEALLARFQDAGERLTACEFIDWVHDDRDMDTRNDIIGELIAIRADAKRRAVLARLVPFLDSPDPSIRHHAAIACLDFAPDKAVAALEGLETDDDPQVRAAAGWTLDRWRAEHDGAYLRRGLISPRSAAGLRRSARRRSSGMGTEEYAQMPTERLLRLFAETANESGVGRFFQYGGGAPPEAILPTREETNRGFARNTAIAGALSCKATALEIEPLFDSDDPDIRICAAALLSEFAPALSEAAWRRGDGQLFDPRGAGAGRARAHAPAGASDPAGDGRRRADGAIRGRGRTADRVPLHRLARRRKGHGRPQRHHRRADGDRRGDRRRGMLARLLPFLDDADPSARLFAALGCLRIAAAKAAATLEEIAAHGNLDDRAVALDNLERWRKGSGASTAGDGSGRMARRRGLRYQGAS